MVVLKWRSRLILSIKEFYISKFNENDIPHIYAICLISIMDFMILLSIVVVFTPIIKPHMIGMSIILLLFNGFVYYKIPAAKKRISIENYIYIGVFIISILNLYFL